MIRAGPVGRRQTCVIAWDDTYDDSYEGTGDFEFDEKGRTMISYIYVSFDDIIRSIQFGYLENGALVLSEQYGPSLGYNFRVVRLNEDEYVTGLSGVPARNGGIRSLTFHTNRQKYGPIGSSDGKNASASKVEIDPEIRDRSEFGGFFGSFNRTHVPSIGIYVNPIVRSGTVVKRDCMLLTNV